MIVRILLCAASLASASAALAAPLQPQPPKSQPPKSQPGDPVKLGGGLTLDPIIEGRLRYEHVDQPAADADAVTLRVRAGAELKHTSGLSLLAEAVGTLGIVNDYNAFPFAITDSQRRPGFAVVADPMTIGLNRLQVQYKSKPLTVTLGRQRINLDDQRFVGSVGWRQNEQTFDAARVEALLGPVSFDGAYAISQRTIFGIDAGLRTAHDGNLVFLGAATKLGPVSVKAFSYLLDYDTAEQVGSLAISMADTQTYGVRATGSFAIGKAAKLNLAASYARQSDWQQNPVNYTADYIAAEASIAHGPVAVTAGYELLGSAAGVRSFQTPLATLHKFNGWADLFLVTPASGLQDIYGGASLKLPRFKALPGLNLAASYHRFESDFGGLHYGDEFDASLGFKLGRMNLLAKYADYQADRFSVNTRKFWLQLEFAY